MAQQTGRREVVEDPLAQAARSVSQPAQMQQTSIQRPAMPSMAGVSGSTAAVGAAMDGLSAALQKHQAEQHDEMILEGKTAYLTGVAEKDLLDRGERFTSMGYNQLKVKDEVSQWFMTEAADIEEKQHSLDPKAYQEYLTGKRKAYLDGIEDPYSKQVAVAAFEQFSPQLATAQFNKNNEYNLERREGAFGETLRSSAASSGARPATVVGESSLKLSAAPVLPVMMVTAKDRDIGIRTILGEAAGSGDMGMAGVAHVLRNRATDGGYPKSIAGVSLQDKQFSAWNKGKGGNNLVHKYKAGDAMYEKAGKVFDAVMSGRHIDPTNGATHYYSPSGMQDMKNKGQQSHLVPKWWNKVLGQSGGKSVQLGGHLFAGKSRGAASAPRATEEYHDPLVNAGYDPATYKPVEIAGQPAGEDNNFAARFEGVPNQAGTIYTPDTTDITQMNEQVAENEGVPAPENATGIEAPKVANEANDLLSSYSGLNNKSKAKVASKEMVRGLLDGDDTLYESLGGVGALQNIGATDAQIDAVLRAKDRFDAKKAKEYDAAAETWRNDILSRAGKPDADMVGINAEIEQALKDKMIDDSEAKSLIRTAFENQRQLGKVSEAVAGNPLYLDEVGGLFQEINTGSLTFEEAAAKANALSAKYGATPQETQALLGQAFSHDQAQKNSLRTGAKAANDKALKNQAMQAEADAALGRGYGLNLLNKTMTAVGQTGKEESMTQQEYAIAQIKDKNAQSMNQLVTDKKLSQSEATARVYSDTYQELQKHDIVDKKAQAQLVGAITGDIMNKDGSVNDSALQAYDMYQILRRDPNISDAYLDKMVGDTYTRGVLTMAATLDAGGLSGAESLLKAKAMMDDPMRDPEAKFQKDAVFNGYIAKETKNVATKLANDPAWVGAMTGGQFGGYDATKIQKEYGTVMERYLASQADMYKQMHPAIDAESAMKMASSDLQNNSISVAGNLIISNRFDIAERIGLKEFGKTGVDEAFKSYMGKYAHNIPALAKHYALAQTTAQYQTGNIPWNVQYNASLNTFDVAMYKDGKLDISTKVTISAKAIAQEYIKDKQSPSAHERMFKGMFEAAGAGLRKVKEHLATDPNVPLVQGTGPLL